MSKDTAAELDLPDRLLTPEQYAQFVGTTIGNLAVQRHKGEGPRFVKCGKSVRYRWSDIVAWLDENTRERTGRSA